VESSHSDLSEVTRVELIHQNSVVVLTSGITTTSRMGSVLTNTTVTSTNVSSLLSVVVESGFHCLTSLAYFLTFAVQNVPNAAMKSVRPLEF
jgi:hypothetical protein